MTWLGMNLYSNILHSMFKYLTSHSMWFSSIEWFAMKLDKCIITSFLAGNGAIAPKFNPGDS